MKIKESVFLTFLIFPFCIACSGNSNSPKEEKQIVEELSPENIEIHKVATSFYEWYINYIDMDNCDPKIDIIEDGIGIHSLSNVDKYMELLYSLKTLSPRFLKMEHQRLIDCDCFLKAYDWTNYENTYDFEDTPCDFFTYKYWFKSQEDCHKVTVSSMNRNNTNDTISVNLTFFFVDKTGEHKQYYTASEILVKSDGKWLIDEIKVDDYCN
jgi:uncharacterized protein YcfL